MRDDLEKLKGPMSEAVARLEKKFPYAAAFAMVQRGLTAGVSKREEHVADSKRAEGMTLTVFDGEFQVEESVAGLSPDDLSACVARMMSDIPVKPSKSAVETGTPVVRHFGTALAVDPTGVPLADKLDSCREIRSAGMAADKRIVDVRANIQEFHREVVFVNRARVLGQEKSYITCRVQIVASDGGVIRFNQLQRDETHGFERRPFSDEELKQGAALAVELLKASPMEPGEYDVIATPEVTGLIAHEAFGHGVELDMFARKRALAVDYVGRRVGSDLVNISDDPTIPGLAGSSFFDDEGELTRKTRIILNGIFVEGISDLFASMALKLPRTGNGMREDYSKKAYARMSNTFVEPGGTDPAEILGGLDSGMLVEKSQWGMEDPKGWGVQVAALLGREVRGGRFTGRMFSPVMITGDVPGMLQSVSAVGNDLMMFGGNCIKALLHYTTISTGGPTVRLRARLG
jgi:TldD protein